MGKIVLLVSREEMIYQAHNILQEKKYPIHEMKVIHTEDAVVEARQAIAAGASIIIARGLQASLIKQYTDIPVVEITLTAQEMALLVMRAKQIIKKPKPVIAVIGFKNMFSDMTYFEELYDIELRTYYAGQGEELKPQALKAIQEGADLIIGGDTAVATATEQSIPSLFLSITEESLRNAFSIAQSMDYAVSVEKKSAAQMETLLDYTFSGVVHLDGEGTIKTVNPLMEDMIGKSQEELKGLLITKVMPEIGTTVLNQVLKEGKEYSLFLELNHTSVFAVVAPVLYDRGVDGAIITCHRMKKSKGRQTDDKNQPQGLPALIRFEDILQESESMKACIRTAKLYALSEQPVVITGETGTETGMIAQGIHNSSIRRQRPFVEAVCTGISSGDQRQLLFGDRGLAVQAKGGTLVLQSIENLSESNQNLLCQLIRYGRISGQDIVRLGKIDVRIMVILEQPLAVLMEKGLLVPELYYILSGLELQIPPLRERPEDLKRKMELCLGNCCQWLSRYHVLTEGAKKILMDYSWKGNLLQIESFFERLILTAEKRSVDEIAVKRLIRTLYPEFEKTNPSEDGSSQLIAAENPYYNEEAKLITETLRKCGGSREKTAKELGISKATLWRRMKKYEIM